MIYRYWNNNYGGIGLGFDKDELGHFSFRIEFCLQHHYLFADLALLGLSFDVHVFESDRPNGPELEPGSGT